MEVELKIVRLESPENGNIIVGQSHFVKTVEDLYEAMVNTVPGIKFGSTRFAPVTGSIDVTKF